jgi:hypothetical protein
LRVVDLLFTGGDEERYAERSAEGSKGHASSWSKGNA